MTMHLMRQAIEWIFSPLGILWLTLASGLLLSPFRRYQTTSQRLLILGSAIYLLFTSSPLAETAVGFLEKSYPPVIRPDSVDSRKLIVVLSSAGQEYPSVPVTNNIDEVGVARLIEAARLYHLIPGAKLVVTGGRMRGQEVSIGSVMARFLQAIGVPAEDISVEHQSRNTRENLSQVRSMVGREPFYLVTSAFHMRRSMGVAQKLELKPVPAPAGIWTLQEHPAGRPWTAWGWKMLRSFSASSPQRLAYLQRAYHEYLGYLWYRLLAWL